EPVLPAAPGTPGAVPGAAVKPDEEPPSADYKSRVLGHKPSPTWTQDRNFSSTRFWLLDPGTIEVETWWITRIYDKDPSSVRFLQEIEWGIAPHLQLDLYGQFRLDRQSNISEPNDDLKEQRYLSYKGWQAELRIAIPNYYGQIPLNPVVYLE